MAKNSNSSKASGGAAVSGGAVSKVDEVDDEPKSPAKEQAPQEGEKPSTKNDPKGKAQAPFTVAKGKSVSSRRGILGPGDEVSARDFAAGAERLDELVDAGVLVKA